MNEILYGVGRIALEPFASGDGDYIGVGELKDANISSSYSMEDVTGGNSMFPLASFPKDKSVKFSATNAKFDINIAKYQEGFTTAATANDIMDTVTFTITSTSMKLPKLAIAGSVHINEFTVVEVAPTVTHTFQVTNATDTTLTFLDDDIGLQVTVIYKFLKTAAAKTYEALQTSLQKPMKLTYIFDIYDDNNTIVKIGNLVIYKALCSSGFTIDWAHQTASTQKFEVDAKDPKRLDKKLWDITIDDV